MFIFPRPFLFSGALKYIVTHIINQYSMNYRFPSKQLCLAKPQGLNSESSCCWNPPTDVYWATVYVLWHISPSPNNVLGKIHVPFSLLGPIRIPLSFGNFFNQITNTLIPWSFENFFYRTLSTLTCTMATVIWHFSCDPDISYTCYRLSL